MKNFIIVLLGVLVSSSVVASGHIRAHFERIKTCEDFYQNAVAMTLAGANNKGRIKAAAEHTSCTFSYNSKDDAAQFAYADHGKSKVLTCLNLNSTIIGAQCTIKTLRR